MMRTLRLLARSRPADGALARVSPLTPPGLPPSGVTPPSVSAAGASSSSASSRSRSAGAGAGSRGGGERAGGRGVGKGAARGGAREEESSIKPHARRGGAEGAVEPPREDGSRARRGGTGVDARVRWRARASRVRSRSRGGGGTATGRGAAHLVLDVPDVLVDFALLEQRLERLPLGSARARHGRARSVLVPPRHRAAVEPGVDREVVLVQGRHRGARRSKWRGARRAFSSIAA